MGTKGKILEDIYQDLGKKKIPEQMMDEEGNRSAKTTGQRENFESIGRKVKTFGGSHGRRQRGLDYVPKSRV